MKALRRLRPAIGWGVCLALLFFLLVSFSKIWLVPARPLEQQTHLAFGTFWESLDGIRRCRPEVGLDELLWGLRDNWIIGLVILGWGFVSGCVLFQLTRQVASGIEPPSW